ncbi:DUF771 domain-containing protein [Cohnella rhizosphaerae]
MQQFELQLSIKIPPEYVLIKQVQFEDLHRQELAGVYWNMNDLEHRIRRKSDWIKTNILYPPRFRRILDASEGGFVFLSPKPKVSLGHFKQIRWQNSWTGDLVRYLIRKFSP